MTRYWWLKPYLFNALVVLCLHLIELARAGKSGAEEVSELRAKISEGLEFLQLRSVSF